MIHLFFLIIISLFNILGWLQLRHRFADKSPKQNANNQTQLQQLRNVVAQGSAEQQGHLSNLFCNEVSPIGQNKWQLRLVQGHRADLFGFEQK